MVFDERETRTDDFRHFSSVQTGATLQSAGRSNIEAILTDSVKRAALTNTLSTFSFDGLLGSHMIGVMTLSPEGNGLLAEVPVGNPHFPFRVRGKIAFPVRSISTAKPNYLPDPPSHDLDLMPGAKKTLTFSHQASFGSQRCRGRLVARTVLESDVAFSLL